jgi:hypothetical protein
MKIQTFESTLVYDITNHLREKGLEAETAGYIRFLLEDNIPMTIKIDGKLYRNSWKKWHRFTSAYGDLVGCVCDDTIHHYELAKTDFFKDAVQLTDHALDY